VVHGHRHLCLSACDSGGLHTPDTRPSAVVIYNTREIIDPYFMSKVYIAEQDHSEVYPI
jgi:hypothetical protein